MTSRRTLAGARREARSCTRCPLYKRATQTVFGRGAGTARVVFVGEQPGDVEDREGAPFVGPAGLLLRELLAEAGIDEAVYLTNAVKHFKWRPKGTRRIHDKPNVSEITACRHWLDLELVLVEPELVVCLGATAARAVLGRPARVGELRGRPQPIGPERNALVTLHPSAVLRAGDRRAERRAELLEDLVLVGRLLSGTGD